MFDTFGGNSVTPGQVSYASFSLTASIDLEWPNFAGEGTSVYALWMDFTANSTGYAISMPDATQAGNGTTAIFRNTGSNTVTIKDSAGNTLGTVASGIAKFLILTDNATAAGTWAIITFGAGSAAADAATLAGYGLQAIGATLNQSHPTTVQATTINVSAPSDLAKVYVASGGSIAANLPTSASAGANFFFLIKNDGSGTVTLTPSGADTIDTAATLALAPNDSCMVCSLGSLNGWVTVGYGRNVSFAFTQLVKSVAGNTDVTLTAAECANKLMTFTGALTGNINVNVTSTVSVYYLFNNTSGAFTLTVKTAAGTGIAVDQGTHDIGVCDATNVYRGITNTTASTTFGAGSASTPSVTFSGSSSSGFYLPIANVPGVSANGVEVMSWHGQNGAVNWVDVFAASTGNAPKIIPNGTDGNVSLMLTSKGVGRVQIADGTDNTKIAQFNAAGISANTTRTVALPDANTSLPVANFTMTLVGPTAARSLTIADANVTLADTSTAQALSNKTFNTALNTFSLNGTTVVNATGTGSAVLSANGVLTGFPQVPTQAPLNNSSNAASTQYVDLAVANSSTAPWANTPITVQESNGTITILSTRARVRLVGAGGGGASTNVETGTGGGCGGAYGEKYLTGLTVGNTLNATIGLGGAGGLQAGAPLAGTAGGQTILASGNQVITTISANGGFGGVVAGTAVGPQANTSGTDLTIAGQASQVSELIGSSFSFGGGGSSYLGFGARPVTNASGVNAQKYGAGGSGADDRAANAAHPGGSGSNGVIIIEWYK